MRSPFATVPAVHPDCRITVTIPARDEGALIVRTLEAFALQRAVDGSALSPNVFEVIVFANACRDDTAARARAAARQFDHVRIHVADAGFPDGYATVGSARKRVMDFAAHRQSSVAARAGIVASCDADTIVDRAWIAWLDLESRDAEAVAGQVTVGEAEIASMHAPVRLLYARELAFRRVLAEVEHLIDPREEDPAPRHSSFVGASFGVKAATYLAAGGMPPLAKLEDFAFAAALRRIDARIRHSVRMRATTSARVRPRVEGGFGTFMAELAERGRRRDTFFVEAPELWLERFAVRAALRRIWSGSGTPDDEDTVTEVLGLRPAVWQPRVDRAKPFGTVHAALEERAANMRRRYAPVPVEDAIATLREAAASRKAAQPMRTSAASGAG